MALQQEDRRMDFHILQTGGQQQGQIDALVAGVLSRWVLAA